jgi:predicted ABC-type ATPase
MQELLRGDKSFAFETTASGLNYMKHLKLAREKGYEIQLVFLWLKDSEYAVQRVAQRVKQGGHHVPRETIVRRYHSGIKNLFAHYLPLSDRTIIMDNSGEQERIVAIKARTGSMDILDEAVWEKIKRGSNE